MRNLFAIISIFVLGMGFANTANAACTGDLDDSGMVDVVDLLAVLAQWGGCDGACSADTNMDGAVDVVDLLAILAAWGQCPVVANCDDLTGVDFMGGTGGPMPLGAAVIGTTCQMIFGNEIPEGYALWGNVTECEANCTGCASNDDCLADEYCLFEGYTCGTEGFGACELRAEVCSMQYDPVCTCEFTIAGNACNASRFGMSIQFEGECAQEDVCNYNGGTWIDGDCDCPEGTEYNYQRGCETI